MLFRSPYTFNFVKGMLPKNTLGRKQFTKLNVYGGAEHPHAAQQPEVLDITNLI